MIHSKGYGRLLHFTTLLLAIIIIITGVQSQALASTKLNREELQIAVVNYADRFLAVIGQATFQFESDLPTQEARLTSARRKVYTLSSAVTIASGPDPVIAMLDMAVMVSLNRRVWESYWQPEVFGAPSNIVVDAFKRMEKDIFSIASKLLDQQQIKELQDLIIDWHLQNKDQRAVDFIRFSDFGDLGKKPALNKIKKPGGLLAPVKEAAQAADEIRMATERAMFLITKMQLILGLQAELIYKELIVQPEVAKMLDDLEGFKVQMDNLPGKISAERQAALAQVAELMAQERNAVLQAFDEREGRLSAVMKEAQKTIDRMDLLLASSRESMADAEQIAEQAESAGVVFRELVESADRLAARFDKNSLFKSDEPFDIEDYLPALQQLNQTIQNATLLVGKVDQSNAPLIAQLAEEINLLAEKRINHLFWRIAWLFVLAGIIGIILVVVHHLMKTHVSK